MRPCEPTPRLTATDLQLPAGAGRPVDGVSLNVRPGEWLAVVGPNGAGKSSLLTLLAGLRRPAAGQALLDGRPISEWKPSERSRRVAWCAQGGEIPAELRARDVVRLGRLPHHGLSRPPQPADEHAVDRALRDMDCTHLANRVLARMSGGERQRVLLARVFAVQAPILLLDEPTTHLDAPHQLQLVRVLQTHARAGCAVITVMHELNLALMADRLLVLADGAARACGPPAAQETRDAIEAAFRGAYRLCEITPQRWAALPNLPHEQGRP